MKIIPINSRNGSVGVGTIVDGLLITAAHVIHEAEDTSIVYQGKRFYLNDQNMLFSYNDNSSPEHFNPDGLDVAIYRIEEGEIAIPKFAKLDVSSPLVCTTLRYVPCQTDSIFSSSIDFIQPLSSNVEYLYSEGKYYVCNTVEQLHKGDSGAPLIQSGRIIGLLYGGIENTHQCLFLSLDDIRQK